MSRYTLTAGDSYKVVVERPVFTKEVNVGTTPVHSAQRIVLGSIQETTRAFAEMTQVLRDRPKVVWQTKSH